MNTNCKGGGTLKDPSAATSKTVCLTCHVCGRLFKLEEVQLVRHGLILIPLHERP